MRLAKLCITLALATGGWHAALASALCARAADCHASASSRASRDGRETPRHAAAHEAAHAADEQHRAAVPASDAPAGDLKNQHSHCDASAKSPRAAAHAATPHAEHEAAHGNDENAALANVAALRSPGPSCGHCVGRQTSQPARVESSAPAHARDAQAAPASVRHLVAPPRPAPRTHRAPTEHSPPRGRPLHLLNSVLLI